MYTSYDKLMNFVNTFDEKNQKVIIRIPNNKLFCNIYLNLYIISKKIKGTALKCLGP